MSDEPKKVWFERTAAGAIGFGSLLGLGAGLAIALLNPPSLRFWFECLGMGAIFGIAFGISSWLTQQRLNSRANRKKP
jgi:hypothetical protein